MAIQLPPNIQLEQDPYTRSRAGFNSYLDFVKEQKDRVVSARQLAQQKKLLGEQKKDKLAELQAEYDFRLRNETQIQHMRGVQSMEETEYTVNAKREADAMTAQVNFLTTMSKRLDEANTEADSLQEVFVKDYRKEVDWLGATAAVRVKAEMDPNTGNINTYVSVGDQRFDPQTFRSMLESERTFVSFWDQWETQIKTGEAKDTAMVGDVVFLGNDDKAQDYLDSLRNPEHPMHNTNRGLVLAGKIRAQVQPVAGTEEVAKAKDTFADMRNVLAGTQANLVYSPGEYTLRAKETRASFDFLARDTYIDLNQPVAKIREQITKYVNDYEGKDFAKPFADFNSQLATYVTQFQRTLKPDDPASIDPAHIYYNPDNFQLVYDPARSDKLKVNMEQLHNGGKANKDQMFNRFNTPRPK